jgi:hypothetical protein
MRFGFSFFKTLFFYLCLFNFDIINRLKNSEYPDSAELLSTEVFNKITCSIDGHTMFLADGISSSLNGSVEKMETRSLLPPVEETSLSFINSSSSSSNSSTSSTSSTTSSVPVPVGRNCIFSYTKRFAILPPYAVVHLARFFWKKKEEMNIGSEPQRVKIMRKVQFPLILDMFDYCTEQLKQNLRPRRDELRKERELKLEEKKKELESKLDKEDPYSTQSSSSSSSSAVTNPGASVPEVMRVVAPPRHLTGVYELFGVVTHHGKYAEAGHYMAWVKFGKSLIFIC